VSFWVCISCIFLFSNFERHYAMYGYDTDTILLLKIGSLCPVQFQGSMNATIYSYSTRSNVSAASIGITWPITVGVGEQNSSWVLGTHLPSFCLMKHGFFISFLCFYTTHIIILKIFLFFLFDFLSLSSQKTIF